MCNKFSRRDLLKRTAGAGAGLTLGQWLGTLAAWGAEPTGRAKSLIVLWMSGGPSQIDTWDPKPGRPTGGEFKAIPTSVSGIQVAEHLPQIASEMKQLAIIRSVTSKEGNHERARYLVHTGYPPQGPTAHPGFGAIAAQELGALSPPAVGGGAPTTHSRGARDSALPAFVSLNGPSHGPGILGVNFAPFVVQDPTKPIENLAPAHGMDRARFEARLNLLNALDGRFVASHPGAEAIGHETTVRRAVDLMTSPSLDAFDLTKEPEALRQAYGMGKFGQGCLMARRLVEKGVRYVEVELSGWDTHFDNFETTKKLMAELDPGMATLVRDLRDKGVLDSTLVVWMGEFGRTPKINPRGGRDHHPKAWSAVLGGGGVKGGQVVGSTDADGYEVQDRPVTVPELYASICYALGIDPDKVNYSPLGRPIPLTDKGKRVPELFG